LHCIDSICFHAGGPLALGDIEDVDGNACLTCPWHFYKVSITDGNKYYQTLEKDETGKMVPGSWKTVGVRQRVHKVEEREDGAYVQLSTEGELASDHYAKNQDAGDRIIASEQQQQQQCGPINDQVGRLPPAPCASLQGAGVAPWALGDHVRGEDPTSPRGKRGGGPPRF